MAGHSKWANIKHRKGAQDAKRGKMNSERGFNLIELMIVITIIAILSTIAYPTFEKTLYQARRTDGQLALLALQNVITEGGN